MGSTTLTSFADLPNELSSRIIDVACERDSTADAAASPIGLDISTLLNLILVSRHLYPTVAEKLYRRIRITTISALRSLAFALVSRPALGRCIKSIHFGPEDNLPEDWTPIVYEAGGEGEESEGVMCLATSLGPQPGDADRLPRWCLPLQHWPTEGSATTGKSGSSNCRHQAIVEAVQSAVTTLDVAPGRPHEDASGENIGRDAWAVRLWMAKAALDLYLTHLRILEDQAASSQPHHPTQPDGRSYPRLALKLSSTAMASAHSEATASLDDSQAAITLTEAQLLPHLERRGSATDRLDHPIILARSGVLGFNIEAKNEPDDVYLRGDGPYSLDQRLEQRHPDREAQPGDCVDLFSIREGQTLMQKVVSPARKSTANALDPAVSSGATIGSLLGLARSIVSLTPSLANLSLTGIFERIICGSRPPPGLKALRFLSIGPSPPCWHLELNLNAEVLEKLKGLRLCGVELWEAQTKSIAGHEGALPCLRELRYTMADGTSVGRLARGLTERFGPPNREEEQLRNEEDDVAHMSKSTSDSSEGSTSSGPTDSSDATSSSEFSDAYDSLASSDSSNNSTSSPRPLPAQSPQRLLIDLRLSPHQMGHIKANRPSALYDAYVNEEVLAYGPRHRLFIEEDPELEFQEEEDGPLFPKKLPADMWEEAREWWGECAGRCEGEKKGQ